MKGNIQSLSNIAPINRVDVKEPINRKSVNDNSFATTLKTALNQISKAEHESNKKTEQLVQGKIDNLHDVMITAQKASITVETAVQVQQKVIDIYNEMMRMQV